MYEGADMMLTCRYVHVRDLQSTRTPVRLTI